MNREISNTHCEISREGIMAKQNVWSANLEAKPPMTPHAGGGRGGEDRRGGRRTQERAKFSLNLGADADSWFLFLDFVRKI